ncbi:hypothetical protein GWI33_003426 [Rhynchophorus ferrugineus]|uniref:Uncharacterized protein n=1 Tax=Rhynchophorus ferrugineus TaxID=354439 RepID=A0A834IWQ0_RHYFE|nr:hypothetical protein GWI33_003426 [Rhynchophorus ferrugineus]
MSKDIEYSDSSDDEVWFGKYTLKEAKRDIAKYFPKKLNKRHTLNLKLSSSNMSTDDKETKNSLDQLNNYLDNHLNISSIPSEYLTANESGSANRQSLEGDFIQKLTNVINNSSSKESSYKTACDQTNTTISTKDECNETKAEFAKRFENQPMLENIQHTLVENTIYADVSVSDGSIDDSVITLSDDSFQILDQVPKQEINSTYNNSFEYMDNIPEKFEEIEVNHTNSLYQKTNSSSEINNTDSTSELSAGNVYKDENMLPKLFMNKIPILINNTTNLNENYNRLYNFNCLSKISEKTETTTHIENNEFQKDSYSSISETYESDSKSELTSNLPLCGKSNGSELNEKLNLSEESQNLDGFEVPKISETYESYSKSGLTNNLPLCGKSNDSELNEKLNTSEELDGFEVPKINLEQFDDSCNFDDTLEEMNRFLTEDLTNTEPKNNLLNKSQNTNGSDSSLNSLPVCNKPSSIEKHKIFYSGEKISKPRTDLYTCKTIEKSKHLNTHKLKSPVSKKTLFTNTGAKPKSGDIFKVPSKPLKTVLTPSKPTSIFLKNVVSPVSVYINNTPKYSPVVKNSVTQRRLEKPNIPSAKKENIPSKSCNLDEIPAVIYKPSKTKHITNEKDIHLPGSIKKLIKDPTLTKHCQKIVDCDQSIERRLIEDEVSIDNSLMAKTDISVLTNKQALIFKK